MHEKDRKSTIVTITSMGNPPYYGGIENVVSTIQNSSLSNKYNMFLFDTYRKPKLNRFFFSKVLFAGFLAISCFLYLIRKRPSIVHIHFCSNNDFVKHSLCLVIAKLLFRKTVFHLHGGLFDKKYQAMNLIQKKVVKLIFSLPDFIVALSKYWQTFLSGIALEEKIVIINNPVDFQNFHFSHNTDVFYKPSFFKILLLGSVGKRKGHFDVLDCLSYLDIEDYSILFAGQDDYIGASLEMIEKAKKLNVEEKIELLGPVDFKHKINLLKFSDIVILPSYGENLPISILEAIAAKKPVVVSNVGALPELLEFGKLGKIIEPGDCIALADSISYVMNNYEEALKNANIAYEIAIEKYDISTIVNEIDKIYNSLSRK